MSTQTQSLRSAVATRDQAQTTKATSIATFIGQLRPEIQRALPKGLDADRIARLALTEVRTTPKLATCTPESFAGALLKASALGLEPGVGGEAYLVPHGRECTLIVGYQGLAKLFWQHPMAAHLDARAVHENDEFEYAYGLQPVLRHTPAKGDRGPVAYYYAVVGLANGAVHFEVLTVEEVKRLRGGKVGTSGVPDPMHWMERKTVLKQVLKLVPKSTSLNQALEIEDETPGSVLAGQLTSVPVPEEEPRALGAGQEPPAGVDPSTGVMDEDVVVEDVPDDAEWPPVAEPGR